MTCFFNLTCYQVPQRMMWTSSSLNRKRIPWNWISNHSKDNQCNFFWWKVMNANDSRFQRESPPSWRYWKDMFRFSLRALLRHFYLNSHADEWHAWRHWLTLLTAASPVQSFVTLLVSYGESGDIYVEYLKNSFLLKRIFCKCSLEPWRQVQFYLLLSI